MTAHGGSEFHWWLDPGTDMIDSAFLFLRLRFGHEYPFSCFMVSRMFGMVFFFSGVYNGSDLTGQLRTGLLIWYGYV